jgi:hypothetical protein
MPVTKVPSSAFILGEYWTCPPRWKWVQSMSIPPCHICARYFSKYFHHTIPLLTAATTKSLLLNSHESFYSPRWYDTTYLDWSEKENQAEWSASLSLRCVLRRSTLWLRETGFTSSCLSCRWHGSWVQEWSKYIKQMFVFNNIFYVTVQTSTLDKWQSIECSPQALHTEAVLNVQPGNNYICIYMYWGYVQQKSQVLIAFWPFCGMPSRLSPGSVPRLSPETSLGAYPSDCLATLPRDYPTDVCPETVSGQYSLMTLPWDSLEIIVPRQHSLCLATVTRQ